jgi:hypothetical protein
MEESYQWHYTRSVSRPHRSSPNLPSSAIRLLAPPASPVFSRLPMSSPSQAETSIVRFTFLYRDHKMAEWHHGPSDSSSSPSLGCLRPYLYPRPHPAMRRLAVRPPEQGTSFRLVRLGALVAV